MHTLTARTLVTDIGEVAYPAIVIDDEGLIADISSDPGLRTEAILTATFVDVHLHGAAGYDVMDADPAGFHAIGRFLARRGTSHYLPTTVTASIEATEKALDRIADRIEQPTPGDEASPIGIHLEGPFLSHARRGVHAADLLQPPSVELFERLMQAARGHVRLLTLAPELPGALELIRHAIAKGVRVSLGHTDATYAEAQAALAAGAVSATHTCNGMRPLDHREPGVLGAIFDTPSLYAEMICDGVHVAPALVRMWSKLKRDHAILVTDAMAATGMPDGPSTLAGLPVVVRDGKATLRDAPATLAGSVLTLDRAVQNLVAFTGCALAEAVRAASSQPAAMLGLTYPLMAGQPANFNQWSPAGILEATYLHGRRLS